MWSHVEGRSGGHCIWNYYSWIFLIHYVLKTIAKLGTVEEECRPGLHKPDLISKSETNKYTQTLHMVTWKLLKETWKQMMFPFLILTRRNIGQPCEAVLCVWWHRYVLRIWNTHFPEELALCGGTRKDCGGGDRAPLRALCHHSQGWGTWPPSFQALVNLQRNWIETLTWCFFSSVNRVALPCQSHYSVLPS